MATSLQSHCTDVRVGVCAGTLAHYRNWSAQVQARYQMFNPEAIRPARRIYVGGLPGGTSEVGGFCSASPNMNTQQQTAAEGAAGTVCGRTALILLC